MAVEDTWLLADGVTPSKRYGRGRRWRVRWTNAAGERRARSFTQKRPAELFWHKRVVESDTGEPDLRTELDMGEATGMWLDGKRGLSERGLEACDLAARTVDRSWAGTMVADVTPSDAARWVGSLTGSPSRKHKILQAFRGALQAAVRDGYLESNPAAGLAVAKETPREAHFLTVAQLAILAEAAPQRDRPMVWFLGTTGVRIGEACALNVGDVDRARRRARIRTSKNGQARDVPVTSAVLDMLDLDRPAGDPLFCSPGGARVDVRNWRRTVFGAARSAEGLPAGLVPHDLRHTAASLAIAAGADVKVLQRMLGHKSAKLTLDRYGHLFDRSLDTVADALGGLVDRYRLGTPGSHGGPADPA